jgi:soluble lytic murein transglycosylase-like protein
MNRDALTWLLGGTALAVLIWQRQSVSGAVQSGVEDVQAAVQGWASVNQGPVWVPVLNIAEGTYGIPPNLLARVAYEESRFRDDVISGATASPAGAMGLMQLEPAYFQSVKVPTPYTAADVNNQIAEAAAYLAGLYKHFNDWGYALMAYNDGQTNIDNYIAGTHPLPTETINYVADILTDVPLAGASMPS